MYSCPANFGIDSTYLLIPRMNDLQLHPAQLANFGSRTGTHL